MNLMLSELWKVIMFCGVQYRLLQSLQNGVSLAHFGTIEVAVIKLQCMGKTLQFY